MAIFDKIAVMEKIGSTGMVPVFYHPDTETVMQVVKACYAGGSARVRIHRTAAISPTKYLQPSYAVPPLNAPKWPSVPDP